ncbi:TPA: hypothetical protein KSL76_001505 [Clostridioides difficile]|nr:hypothetical protein [Clostridioides difficile]EQE32144.1 hypothetical protein QC3_0809 [Clostridioides difficile CD22]MCP3361700.1 hypothetical protein [Clostridioides difficile]HBF2926667.1 hypothetical protein [Clostridioides difficile]HBF4667723.1 hypothetical protein [Clostridioides difficile]HBF5564921.1 hypothetical protein [Clostridioides difficile]
MILIGKNQSGEKKINTNLVKLSKLKETRLKFKDDSRDNYFESDSLQHV